MNFYEMLNKLEEIPGSNDKEAYLIYILTHVKNAEAFFRFTFNDQVYGVKEQTFNNIYGPHQSDHISDYFGSLNYNTYPDDMKVPDLIHFGTILLNNSGQAQQEQIKKFFDLLSSIKRKWFCRAILKDLRCGVQVKTINKCFKELGIKPIEKFALQLCGKLDVYDEELVKKKITFPCSMECKYDGIRVQAEIFSADGATFCLLTSRRGKDKTEDYPEIVAALREKFAGENIILDGEVISKSFQDLTRKDSTAKKKYVVFDLLVDEKLIYMNRWDNLVTLFMCSDTTDLNDNKNIIYNKNTIVLAEHYSCNNIKELQEYYEELNERKEEGVIIKLDNAIYERGSRKNMFKCKKVYTADLLCIDYKLGTGKRSGMVSTLCLEDKSKTIKVDVGSGIDDATSERLTNELNELKECGDNPWDGLIVEIKYNEITETGSIRFPRFVCFREDKDTPDDLSQTEVRQNV